MDFYIKRPDSNDCLAHHGILGMKWGQRNGPPYPLDSKTMSSSEKKARKRASDLSDEELRSAINRMNLEKQYEELSKKEEERSRKLVKKALISIGAVAFTTITKTVVTRGSNMVFDTIVKKK